MASDILFLSSWAPSVAGNAHACGRPVCSIFCWASCSCCMPYCSTCRPCGMSCHCCRVLACHSAATYHCTARSWAASVHVLVKSKSSVSTRGHELLCYLPKRVRSERGALCLQASRRWECLRDPVPGHSEGPHGCISRCSQGHTASCPAGWAHVPAHQFACLGKLCFCNRLAKTAEC